MNLLDYLNIGSDPRSAMMMGLAGGLLQGPTRPGRQTFGEAFGSGIQGAMQAQQAAQRQAMMQQELGMREADLGIRRDEAGMRREQYEAEKEQARTAKERAAEIERRILEVDPSGRLLMAYRIDPKTVTKQLFPETGDPVVVQAGGALVDRAGKQLFRNPAEEKKPDFLRLMESAGIQPGTPQWNAALNDYIRKQSTHAPAASANVYTGTLVPAEVGGKQVFVMPSKDGGAQVVPGITPPGVSETQEKAAQRDKAVESRTDLIINKVDSALGKVGFFTAGTAGAILGNIPGTPAYDLRADVKTVQANIGFQELQQMREASPTGGALGQVAVQELNMLQAVLGNLDPNQSAPELQKNLTAVRSHFNNWRRAVQAAKGQAPQGVAPAPAAPKRLRFNPQTGRLE